MLKTTGKVKETGPKEAFGSANKPPPKPKYEVPAEKKPKAKPLPKHPVKLPPVIKKEELHVREKHPPVPSAKDLRKQAQTMRAASQGKQDPVIINNTSSNIATMDPTSGNKTFKAKFEKQMKAQHDKEVVVKQLQKVGVLPSGKEIKRKVEKRMGDTRARMADAGAASSFGGQTKAKEQFRMPKGDTFTRK